MSELWKAWFNYSRAQPWPGRSDLTSFEQAENGSVWAISAIRLDTHTSWREECCPRLARPTTGATKLTEIRPNEDFFHLTFRILFNLSQPNVPIVLKNVIFKHYWFFFIRFFSSGLWLAKIILLSWRADYEHHDLIKIEMVFRHVECSYFHFVKWF